MALPKYYNTGLVSIESGSTALIGHGTAWSVLPEDGVFRKGGYAVRVAAVTSDQLSTLAEPWPGVDLEEDTYEIGITFDGPQYQLEVRELLNLVRSLSSVGVYFNAFGLFADRDDYDGKYLNSRGEPWGYLSLDGDGDAITNAVVFYKASAISGDWTDAVDLKGAQGDDGFAGEPLRTTPSAAAGLAAGAHPMIHSYHATGQFTRLYAEAISGTGSAVCYLRLNGVDFYGPFTIDGSASAIEVSALGLNMVEGDDLDLIIESVTAPLYAIDVRVDRPASQLVAAGVPFTPAGSVAATNLQAAVAELDGDITALAASLLPQTKASAAGPASIQLAEDTDNGANKVTLKAPAALAADADVVLPGAAGTLATLAGAETLSGKTLVDPAITGTIAEDVYTIADGAAFEIDPGNGSIQLITLGAARTPKGTNFAAGETVTLAVDDGTAYGLTWSDTTFGPAGVKWIGGSAPTLATSGLTWITLWKVGSQVYGSSVGSTS